MYVTRLDQEAEVPGMIRFLLRFLRKNSSHRPVAHKWVKSTMTFNLPAAIAMFLRIQNHKSCFFFPSDVSDHKNRSNFKIKRPPVWRNEIRCRVGLQVMAIDPLSTHAQSSRKKKDFGHWPGAH